MPGAAAPPKMAIPAGIPPPGGVPPVPAVQEPELSTSFSPSQKHLKSVRYIK